MPQSTHLEAAPAIVMDDDSLGGSCLRHWFELDFCAQQQACERAGGGACGGDVPVAERLCVLAEHAARADTADPAPAFSAAPPELRSVFCVAACDALLCKGDSATRIAALRAEVGSLLEAGGLPLYARSALLLRKALLALILDSDAPAASACLEEGERSAALAGSRPLRIVHRAFRCLLACLSGTTIRAEVCLADAETLERAEESIGLLPQVLLAGAQGITAWLRGEVAQADAILGAALALPGIDTLADAVVLPLLAHRLYVAAELGHQQEVSRLSGELGERAIPQHKRILEAYRHVALGVLALHQHDAARALAHAEESLASDHADSSVLPCWLAQLLRIQALADLERGHEARRLAQTWLPRWTGSGFSRFAASVEQELAWLDFRAGAADKARQHLRAAQALTPPGEPLPALHRSRAWLAALQAQVAGAAASPWVTIRTLGEFVVEVGGKRIYDRDWKGQRARTLLIALICGGGHKVPAERLADLLWPDADGDRAMQNLKVTLHRLRRLGCGDDQQAVNWVHVKNGLVSLSRVHCQVDVFDLMQPGFATTSAAQLDPADFLATEHAQPWITAYRQHLAEMLKIATPAPILR